MTAGISVNRTELVVDDAQAAAAIKKKEQDGQKVTKAEAAQGTIAYGILRGITMYPGNMDKLQIKFDKLTSRHYVRRNHTDSTCIGTGEVPDSVCTDELPQQPLRSGRHHQRG